MSKIPFTPQQAHDLALIWTQTKWNKEFSTIDEQSDELDRMEYLFEIYRDAYSYFYGFSEGDSSPNSEET